MDSEVWEFEREVIKTKKFKITGLCGNFLKYNDSFRTIRKDKDGKCGLCGTDFQDDEYMTLAINNGTNGNLLLCDDCRDEAIQHGVQCTYRETK